MRQLFTFHVLYHLPIDTQQSPLNPQDTHWKWYYCYFRYCLLGTTPKRIKPQLESLESRN